jgi:hypothetical protein
LFVKLFGTFQRRRRKKKRDHTAKRSRAADRRSKMSGDLPNAHRSTWCAWPPLVRCPVQSCHHAHNQTASCSSLLLLLLLLSLSHLVNGGEFHSRLGIVAAQRGHKLEGEISEQMREK